MESSEYNSPESSKRKKRTVKAWVHTKSLYHFPVAFPSFFFIFWEMCLCAMRNYYENWILSLDFVLKVSVVYVSDVSTITKNH